MIQVAADTFSIDPPAGSQGRTRLGNEPAKIFSALKSSVFLLRDGDLLVALLTSDFMSHYYVFSNFVRERVGRALGIPPMQVLCFSSHNHCCVKLNENQFAFGRPNPDIVPADEELTDMGRELLEGYVRTASRLASQLQDVTVRYGRGTERRITHNRKGRRADGSTYLMREEDRLRLGEDFCGDIDDDAFVVGFFDAQNRPVAMLTQFTGHPVTAFHCDHPIIYGEFPRVACDDLSAAMGGIPVGFLQGCAGDTNSKGLLAATPAEENVQRAERYGHQLGETFLEIAQRLTKSERDDLRLVQREVRLPFRDVPPREELEARFAATEEFLQRCDAGDAAGTLGCDGLNFPSNMSVPYRRVLITPVRKWLAWALSLHEPENRDKIPREIEFRSIALRIGDVGIVGMPCEPLLGVGRRIKQNSPTPLTLPCGYLNDSCCGYVPDGPNCEDLDYVSASYRYTESMLPYRQPAGDTLADAAVEMLAETLKEADR